MPARHRYKCQNSRCPEYRLNIFSAMNSPTPECPECRSIKLEDWGLDAMLGILSGSTRSIDATVRRQADRHGLTNINNKDGGPAKRAAAADGKYGTKNYFGVDCPIGDTAQTISGASPFTTKASATARIPGDRAAAVSGMSRTVAEHKGSI